MRATPSAVGFPGATGRAGSVARMVLNPGIPPLIAHDMALGLALVAGADEAGRGCLAGPIVAAAVCLDMTALDSSALDALRGLDDSKRLTARRRAALVPAILRIAHQVVVVSAPPRAIDTDGLHATNLRIIRRALAMLDPVPGIALVDGFALGDDAPPHRQVVRGDSTSAAIAAASVIAKETRDRLMRGPAAAAYGDYGFERHVGYITAEHSEAVRTWGPTPLHRRSFRTAAYGGDPTLFA